MKYTHLLASALVAVFAFASSAIAQDDLPKFKQDALSFYLSPSNQIHNIGFGEYKSEKQRMNEIADIMEPILKKQGLKVYRNDPEKGIRDYTAEAIAKKVDLYLAVHSNAFNGEARGTCVYCHKKGGESERFAKLINEGLMEFYEGRNRGIYESRNRYGEGVPMHEPSVDDTAGIPAALVEIAFHDNEIDSKWILDNKQRIAESLARAILVHLATEHPEAVEGADDQENDSAEDEFPTFKQDAVSFYLSPSNQIHNIGFGEFKSEKQRMNEVADVMEPILKAHGVKVYRNDPEKSIRDYTAEAAEKKVDLYLAVHSNAFKGQTRGTEIFCHKKGGEGERFAKVVNDAIMSIYDGPNRGIKQGFNNYGEGKHMHEPSVDATAGIPACLVEIAFHDNETDSKWILENKELIGKTLAGAVLTHLANEHPDAVQK